MSMKSKTTSHQINPGSFSMRDHQEIFSTLSPFHVIPQLNPCVPTLPNHNIHSLGESSCRKKMKIDHEYEQSPAAHEYTYEKGFNDDDQSEKMRHHERSSNQQRIASERKRRDLVREKLRNLKELLPNTTPKLDQATLLDEAAKRIVCLRFQLQLLCMEGLHHVACMSNSGFMGQDIGMNYGMGFPFPLFRLQQSPSPVSPLVVPSMLIPGLQSIFRHPVPGELSSHETVPASSGASQGNWEPSTGEIPRGQASISMTTMDVAPDRVEEGTSFSSGFSRFTVSSPSQVGPVTSSTTYLPSELGSRVQSADPLLLFGNSQSLPPRTSAVGFSTSSHSIHDGLESQIPRTTTNPDQMPGISQRPMAQDQFSTNHFLQELATSSSSNMLEMVPGIDINDDDAALYSPPFVQFS